MSQTSNINNESPFYLSSEEGVLKLCRKNSKEKINVDFLDHKFQFRLKTLSKNQPLFKAIGIRNGLKILDATAGLGKDALSFVAMGANVTAVEENETVFLLLEDGLKRALVSEKFQKKFQNKIQIQKSSSLDFMKNLKKENYPDVIYLDPMYPETEKSAKPKKDMLFLRELLRPTENLEELLKISLAKANERVVLKRPVDSNFLLQKPTHTFQSKLVRFDMYAV